MKLPDTWNPHPAVKRFYDGSSPQEAEQVYWDTIIAAELFLKV